MTFMFTSGLEFLCTFPNYPSQLEPGDILGIFPIKSAPMFIQYHSLEC